VVVAEVVAVHNIQTEVIVIAVEVEVLVVLVVLLVVLRILQVN
jgi:hypothetical protein